MSRGLLAAALFCLMAGGALPSVERFEPPPRESVRLQEQTGSVVGKIELHATPQVVRRERGGRYQTMGSMPGMNEREVKQSEQHSVVVYLEGGSLETAALQSSSHGVIDQQQAAFIPQVLAVQK